MEKVDLIYFFYGGHKKRNVITHFHQKLLGTHTNYELHVLKAQKMKEQKNLPPFQLIKKVMAPLQVIKKVMTHPIFYQPPPSGRNNERSLTCPARLDTGIWVWAQCVLSLKIKQLKNDVISRITVNSATLCFDLQVNPAPNRDHDLAFIPIQASIENF